MNANISTRDNADSASVAGTTVPSLNTRSFQTTVVLREGQTLAVAGLLQTNYGAGATRVPWFGDLPIVGRAFASDNTSSGEEELVMLVTPTLAHPVDCQQAHDLARLGRF